ncbi:MAG TPA: tRNA lysidine(34) synthetase TilS [Vicinamibacterales bacterium]|nr:tRNA lysidine(34) synthetase TilS [Vicinamibacterales bacterium]
MDLLSRVRRSIERQALCAPGARILVALSGGADSVALLLILRALQDEGVVEVAGAAHLNHQLRGADADADEAFCAALAGRIGVPFISERVDVAALARAQKRSLEDAARTARYAFLARAADRLGAHAIAVAHTREDQAETFLLRLLRGAGTRGLAAIQPRAGRVVRPLLEVERAALRAFLEQLGESFREDATNADVSIPRNRVRHELIPFLRSHFSPGVVGVLAREAALARQDEEFLQAEAIKLAARIVLFEDDAIRIDIAGLRDASPALTSRVVQAALQHHAGRKPIAFDHIKQVLALAAGLERPSQGAAKAGSVSLPGQTAARTGGSIVLRRRLVHRSPAREGGNSFAFPLSIPGEVELGPQRLAVGAERLPALYGEALRWAGRGTEVGIAEASVHLPLGVRSRRPGDRFTPLGGPGARKLQDFLVDRKVARDVREGLPLVVDGRDRIVWVVGQSVAEDFRVTDPSQGVILLKVRHLGGPG